MGCAYSCICSSFSIILVKCALFCQFSISLWYNRKFRALTTCREKVYQKHKSMKTIPLVFVAVLATAATVRSQETEAADSRESTTAPVTSITTARILGNIPDGTPPPPEPPKPKFIVPSKDILSTTTHEQGGRTITIQRIKPIDLPPPPPPAVATAAPSEEFKQRLAEYRLTHPRSGMLFLSATVFRSKDTPPRTLVRYWPEGKGETITFWSSADFALIAGGIQSFVDSAQDTHCMFMGWGNVDIDRMTDLRAAKELEYDAPDMPDFPEGKATYQIVGIQPAAEELVPIQSLHDLYNSEHERLTTAYEGRERARIAHEAYLKAHPPRPKNITLNFWRSDRPTFAKGGAK
jgi:hypothetical protein